MGLGGARLCLSARCGQELVTDPAVLEHRWSNDGCANIDVVIGEWAARQGLKVFFPTPSLAQHIGDVSTLWPQGRAKGYRKADRFAGDGPAVLSQGEPQVVESDEE